MPRKGRTEKIGKTRKGAEKDFTGSGVEGDKSCEQSEEKRDE